MGCSLCAMHHTGHSVETQWKVDLQVANCPMDHKATPMGPMAVDVKWALLGLIR